MDELKRSKNGQNPFLNQNVNGPITLNCTSTKTLWFTNFSWDIIVD